MNEKALKVLEYHKIIQRLAEHAGSQPGKERCLALVPSDDLSEIQRTQRETTDAVSRILRKGRVSFSGLTDIRGSLRRLEVGSSLNIEELLHICTVMETAARVKNWAKEAADGRRSDIPVPSGRGSASMSRRTADTGSDGSRREPAGDSDGEDSLAQMFSDLQPLTSVSTEIRRCILSEDEISDDASSGLRQVRRQMKQVNERIRTQLASFLNGSSRTYLQDAVVTQRNGRFCIPVKAEYRGQVPGMIHDQSSSGSTVFVEPMSVVKLNNDLRELEAREEQEIEKVLAALSAEVSAHTDALNYDVLLLTELDFIFARAQLSLSYKGTEPVFNTEGRINIKKGRHPLLDPKKVVPVDIRLGDDFTLLVISGPNTGGKTVSLKTVGLFTLLGQAGLHIPALDHSELSVFSEVYADIGDEQSIEQSLSTFSSHMTNIVSFLKAMDEADSHMWDPISASNAAKGSSLASDRTEPGFAAAAKVSSDASGITEPGFAAAAKVSSDASGITEPGFAAATVRSDLHGRTVSWGSPDDRTAGERSLVLFDELGAGTDPTEGAALAIAILSNLHARGVRTIATTHYSELKVYALSTPGVENGCCEFDVETLRPTYRLLIGVPGKSNAFAISEKLGLPDYIISDAKEHLTQQEEDFEDVIANLEKSRSTIEKEEAEITRYKQEIEDLKQSLSRKEERLDENRDAILQKAREEARDILRDAKDYADEAIRKFNKMGKESGSLNKMEQERTKLRGKMSDNDAHLGVRSDRKPKKELSAKDLKIGDGVKVLSLNLTGTVSALPDTKGNLFVQMGILRSQVNIKDLEKLDDEPLTTFSGSKTAGGRSSSGGSRSGSPGSHGSKRSGGRGASGNSGSSGNGNSGSYGGSSGFRNTKSYDIRSEINLIGKTSDEAITELDKYMDDAVLAHLSPVRIVHGKGSGVLRKAVHQYLRRQSYVASFRLGEFGEGDSGVTIVELK